MYRSLVFIHQNQLIGLSILNWQQIVHIESILFFFIKKITSNMCTLYVKKMKKKTFLLFYVCWQKNGCVLFRNCNQHFFLSHFTCFIKYNEWWNAKIVVYIIIIIKMNANKSKHQVTNSKQKKKRGVNKLHLKMSIMCCNIETVFNGNSNSLTLQIANCKYIYMLMISN